MNQTFGSRLGYVAHELDTVIRLQLPALQGRLFNVLRFSSSVSAWEPGLQPTTPDKLQSAVTYVAGWTASGGTNTKDALQKAYSDPDVEAVYLLSDGMPNGSPSDIVAAAKTWSKNGVIPCHTIALVAGGTESSQQKAEALSFMEQLAKATKGTYRGLGGS